MEHMAIITDSACGLRRARSIALKKRGCKVAAVFNTNADAAQAFSIDTSRTVFQPCVSDFAGCQAGVAAIRQAFGPVDILVNNAGIDCDAAMHRMTPEQRWKIIQTNPVFMFNMSRNVSEGMRERSVGRIVNRSAGGKEQKWRFLLSAR